MIKNRSDQEQLAQKITASAVDCFGPLPKVMEVEFKNRIRQIVSGGNGGVLAEVESKSVTILLSDIRGFTAIAETYSALTVVDMLNRYFTRMCEVVVRYGGTIDKFMGDSIMALFGAPSSESDDVQRALACAVEMQLAMSEINEHNARLNLPALYMGIGINTGQVVAGQLGSALHSEYTVIGDEVNLTSRIEAQSLRGQILISENTFRLAEKYIEVGSPNRVQVKGKRQSVFLYELLAVRKPRLMYVPRREDRKSPRVEIRMPLQFQCVQKKEVLTETYQAELVDLGYNGLLAMSPIYLAPFSEIRLIMATSLLGAERQVYARILTCEAQNDDYRCSMEFTSIDDIGQTIIKNTVDRLVCHA